MIICHKLKIIFVKTKKVGGTSFEIALSKYCDRDDILTPLIQEDELTRKKMGFQGPSNFLKEQRMNYISSSHPNSEIDGDFTNHIDTKKIYARVGKNIFNDYKKVSIHRDIPDFLISMYYWKIPENKDIKFKNWLEKNYLKGVENFLIAPTKGKFCIDVSLKYETLYEDIEKVGCFPKDFISILRKQNAKAQYRKPHSRNIEAFFKENGCSEYINLLRNLSFKFGL